MDQTGESGDVEMWLGSEAVMLRYTGCPGHLSLAQCAAAAAAADPALLCSDVDGPKDGPLMHCTSQQHMTFLSRSAKLEGHFESFSLTRKSFLEVEARLLL